MTGPEHYREAERLLAALSADHVNESLLAAAQVHATLAVAAATALNDADGGMRWEDWDPWREAASQPRRAPAEGGA